jgi:hypothetical protein
MIERTGVDRRPGVKLPVKKPIRTFRFAHLARSGPKESLLLTSSMAFATFITVALLYGFDGYFFDGHYGSAVWKIFQQIGGAFRL